jgi:hypothetical protein
MPEDVRSGRHAFDPAALTRARNYAGDLGGRAEWPERGLRAYEQMRIGGLGTGRGNVVQDRVANILGQRQPVRPTRLALDRQVTGPPVDIVEVHILNIAGTQAEPGEQENDGLVPNFHRAICRTGAMICSIVAGSTWRGSVERR